MPGPGDCVNLDKYHGAYRILQSGAVPSYHGWYLKVSICGKGKVDEEDVDGGKELVVLLADEVLVTFMSVEHITGIMKGQVNRLLVFFVQRME